MPYRLPFILVNLTDRVIIIIIVVVIIIII